MLSLSSGAALARALTLPIDGRLKGLLATRRDQLGGELAGAARFVVVQPRDPPSWVEDALGFSVFQNPGDGTWHGDPDYSPGFDVIEDHGFAYELTFEFTADFTHVVIVEKAAGIHRNFLEFCATYAPQHA
ncbi:hypothetical protein [Sphingomonas sp.]|jgi:hypothetical protein|uniref:hypothetical protein n=1 Tax=Sphingomonas sp. TaxID=28214 RepID=UPI00184F5138|nr:hypothetical protein [Sphingomonas sp.]MBA3511248.1 hypothetical protein [Sphingomonas sp.]